MIADVEPFRSFSPSHLAAIAATIALAAGLALWVRNTASAAVVRAVCWFIALGLAVNELIFYGVGLSFSLQIFLHDYMPIHVCGVAAWLTIWMLLRRNQWTFEIIYFLGLGGTFQAIITPSMSDGFPAYRFWQFFITHGLIVAGVAVATWGLRMRPRPGSVARVFAYTNIYLVIAAVVDRLVGANYMFLCAPPTGASPFFFLPWPWYLAFLEVVALAIMLLLNLPFYLSRKRVAPQARK